MRFEKFWTVNSDIKIDDTNAGTIAELVEGLLQKFADKYDMNRWEVDEGFFELHIKHLGNSIYCIRIKHIFNVKDTFERSVIFGQPDEPEEDDSAEELNDMLELIWSITEQTGEVEFNIFLNIICMLLEERCKQEQREVVEIAMYLLETIVAVNEEHGRY